MADTVLDRRRADRVRRMLWQRAAARRDGIRMSGQVFAKVVEDAHRADAQTSNHRGSPWRK